MNQTLHPPQLFLLLGTLCMALLMRWQGAPLSSVPESAAGIVSFELARTKAQASAIRNAWGETEAAPLVQIAIQNTRLDFAFILFYMLFLYVGATVTVVPLPSKLGTVAGYTGLLILIAALMDVIENGLMLYQLQHRITSVTAMATFIAATLKFVLLLLCALWIIFTALLRFFTAVPTA